MPDNGEILAAINGLHSKIDKQGNTLSETKNKVDVMASQMNTVELTVVKHEKVLYGTPEQMGKGGLIHKQGEQDTKIGDNATAIAHTRSIFIGIWLGVTLIANLIFNYVKGWLTKSNG